VTATPVQAEPAKPAPAPVVRQPEPEPEEVIDPNRPKRSGWWAKAKSALGG
jgi:ribonuclease E